MRVVLVVLVVLVMGHLRPLKAQARALSPLSPLRSTTVTMKAKNGTSMFKSTKPGNQDSFLSCCEVTQKHLGMAQLEIQHQTSWPVRGTDV